METECFGLTLAIRNKDTQMTNYLWEQGNSWTITHLIYAIKLCTSLNWTEGAQLLIRSKASHSIYLALNPEDKASFLAEICSKSTLLSTELSLQPYAGLCALKYPKAFKAEADNFLMNLTDENLRQYL